MLVRSVPLALCLLWLAYESHFSPRFFVSTLEAGAVSIVSGLEDVLIADQPADLPTLLASANGSAGQ